MKLEVLALAVLLSGCGAPAVAPTGQFGIMNSTQPAPPTPDEEASAKKRCTATSPPSDCTITVTMAYYNPPKRAADGSLVHCEVTAVDPKVIVVKRPNQLLWVFDPPQAAPLFQFAQAWPGLLPQGGIHITGATSEDFGDTALGPSDDTATRSVVNKHKLLFHYNIIATHRTTVADTHRVFCKVYDPIIINVP